MDFNSIPPVVMVLAGMIECVWETGKSAVEEHSILPWDAVLRVSPIVLVTQELIVEASESIESSEDLQCINIRDLRLYCILYEHCDE